MRVEAKSAARRRHQAAAGGRCAHHAASCGRRGEHSTRRARGRAARQCTFRCARYGLRQKAQLRQLGRCRRAEDAAGGGLGRQTTASSKSSGKSGVCTARRLSAPVYLSIHPPMHNLKHYRLAYRASPKRNESFDIKLVFLLPFHGL